MRNTMVEAVAVELAEHFAELQECDEGIGTGAPGVGHVECTIDEVGEVQRAQFGSTTASFRVLIGGLWYAVQVTEQGEQRAPGTFGPWGPAGRQGL